MGRKIEREEGGVSSGTRRQNKENPLQWDDDQKNGCNQTVSGLHPGGGGKNSGLKMFMSEKSSQHYVVGGGWLKKNTQ